MSVTSQTVLLRKFLWTVVNEFKNKQSAWPQYKLLTHSNCEGAVPHCHLKFLYLINWLVRLHTKLNYNIELKSVMTDDAAIVEACECVTWACRCDTAECVAREIFWMCLLQEMSTDVQRTNIQINNCVVWIAFSDNKVPMINCWMKLHGKKKKPSEQNVAYVNVCNWALFIRAVMRCLWIVWNKRFHAGLWNFKKKKKQSWSSEMQCRVRVHQHCFHNH